jgi:signal transduction histidine kinase
LRNLWSNAVKFTPPGGQVSISYRIKGDRVEVTTTDTGVGIKPEHLDHIFDKNKHQTLKGTEGERGTGLGLLLVKELVELNNGTIRIESEWGKGTSVFVSLPYVSVG